MGVDMRCLPRSEVVVDAGKTAGPLELWRHTIGHGGINSKPLPPRVADGLRKLTPRLIRIFIQEFFDVYPEHGRYDWSKLDPYMDSLAVTGAKVVAAITIKPKVLFQKIDQSIWIPNDVAEWQNLIYQMVRRYSVEQPIVSHWEIGNETDIGEWCGCPYLIKSPRDYGEYYAMTTEPILRAFPEAKVGGPALASAEGNFLEAFIDYCLENNLQVDFLSWHLYCDDPLAHAALVKKVQTILEKVPEKRLETMVTEWNKGFDQISVEELAFEPRRAAIAASVILEMAKAGLDWSFYYHAWDQTAYRSEFESFFSDPYIMIEHWNEVPHKFGIFGVDGEVRPQYFVYQMLSQMGNEEISAYSEDLDLKIVAGRSGDDCESRITLLLVNHNVQTVIDKIVTVSLHNVSSGTKILTVYRIDSGHKWSDEELILHPVEKREVDTYGDKFKCQIYSPADSVVMLVLEAV